MLETCQLDLYALGIMFFDNLFQIVFSSWDDDDLVHAIWNVLFDFNQDIYAEDEFNSSGIRVYHPPPFNDVWLDESKKGPTSAASPMEGITEEWERSKWLRVPDPISHPSTTDDNNAQVSPLIIVPDSDDDDSNDEHASVLSHQDGEIHAKDGDLFSDETHPTNRVLGNEDQNNVEYVSPRLPWILITDAIMFLYVARAMKCLWSLEVCSCF